MAEKQCYPIRLLSHRLEAQSYALLCGWKYQSRGLDEKPHRRLIFHSKTEYHLLSGEEMRFSCV